MRKITLYSIIFGVFFISACTGGEGIVDPVYPDDSAFIVTLDQTCGKQWTESDSICINGLYSHRATNISADGTVASFEFDITPSAPYDASFPIGAGDTVPSEQKFSASSPDSEAQLFCGHSETAEITLSNARAYVEVVLSKGDLESISTVILYDLSGEHFSTMRVSAEPSLTCEDRISVLVTIPAGSYYDGFAVTALSGDGGVMEKAFFPNGSVVEPGTTYRLPEISCTKAAEILGGGSGTEFDPYRIGSMDDFNELRSMLSGPAAGKYTRMAYVQTADLDFSTVSLPVRCCSDPSMPFLGKYDGAGKQIIAWHGQHPMFSYFKGEVSDLVFTGVNMESSDPNTGVIASVVLGGAVRNITLSGTMTSSAENTGAVAGVISGPASLVSITSKVTLVSTSFNAGGIIGRIESDSDVHIDKAVAYNKVTGLYNVGEIVGCSNASNGAEIVISNCLCAAEEIEATGNYYDSTDMETYCNVGGVVGRITNADNGSSHHILNCSSVFFNARYPMEYKGEYSTMLCIGGIVGLQDGPGSGSSVEACWSALALHGIDRTDINLAAAVDNNKSDIYPYGGIYGKENGMAYVSCYWMDSTKMGLNSDRKTGNITNCGMTGPYAASVENLNKFVSGYSGGYELSPWVLDGRGYPVPAGFSTDDGSGNKRIRISVIGDSISTFRSWIPIGNAVWYYNGKVEDKVTCDVTVDKTYWHEVAYKYLDNARIEKNIAWSGSCTTSVDDQVSKPGFITRFNKWGIGAPDVVLIHGGTNDRGRNVNGTVVDNTPGCAYNQMPTTEMMEKIFSTPVDQLSEMHYLDAMTKLCRLIHRDHPSAKIVLLTPDRLEEGMYWGEQQIAEHYDYVRIADVRQYGYNNLPKFKGSHPTAAGHDTMARQIISDCKDWIRQGDTQGPRR